MQHPDCGSEKRATSAFGPATTSRPICLWASAGSVIRRVAGNGFENAAPPAWVGCHANTRLSRLHFIILPCPSGYHARGVLNIGSSRADVIEMRFGASRGKMKSKPTTANPISARPRRNSAPAARSPAVNHWDHLASRWEEVGPPLRPCAADVAFYAEAVQRWSASNGSPRALILGVTPELFRLPWPSGSNVLAVDRNETMIQTIWPGPRNTVLRANWSDLPLESASRDLVLCDGGLQLLAYPDGHRRLVESIRRVVAHGGLCIIRMFVPHAPFESPEEVFRDLWAGKIANLNLVKIRLGMALAEGPGQCVRLRAVWEALQQAAPDFPTLARTIGWPLEHLELIHTYRDRHTRYFFLTIQEAEVLFCQSPGGFVLDHVCEPTYELGERCPTVIFRRVG
jgi:SAM-dependent methyltransferase